MSTDLIKIEVSPDFLADSLPEGLIEDAANGFTDVPLEITTEDGQKINYEISYDGESELLAKVISPEDMDADLAREELEEFLDIPEDGTKEEDTETTDDAAE